MILTKIVHPLLCNAPRVRLIAPSTLTYATPTRHQITHYTTPANHHSPIPDSKESRECYIEHLGDDPGISIINLNRPPKKKNALSQQLVHELRECIGYLDSDKDTRVVIVRSLIDKVFCAGADLKERIAMSPAQVSDFVNDLRSTFIKLQTLKVPSIAAINGVAVGGGLELALSCDMRCVGPNILLGLPETKLGIIPGAGGTQLLPRLVGVHLAKELIFTGRIISDPLEAQRINLVNKVHAVDGYTAALELARVVVQNAPVALQMSKRAIDLGVLRDLVVGFLVEGVCYEHVIPTRDRLEGLAAFLEKRKPVYKGQ